MLPEERDPAYLWDMAEAAREVEKMLENYDLPAFMTDLVILEKSVGREKDV